MLGKVPSFDDSSGYWGFIFPCQSVQAWEGKETFMVYVFHGHNLRNLLSFVTCVLDPLHLLRRSKVRELTKLMMPTSTCVFLSRQQLSCCADQSLSSGSLSSAKWYFWVVQIWCVDTCNPHCHHPFPSGGRDLCCVSIGASLWQEHREALLKDCCVFHVPSAERAHGAEWEGDLWDRHCLSSSHACLMWGLSQQSAWARAIGWASEKQCFYAFAWEWLRQCLPAVSKTLRTQKPRGHLVDPHFIEADTGGREQSLQSCMSIRGWLTNRLWVGLADFLWSLSSCSNLTSCSVWVSLGENLGLCDHGNTLQVLMQSIISVGVTDKAF